MLNIFNNYFKIFRDLALTIIFFVAVAIPLCAQSENDLLLLIPSIIASKQPSETFFENFSGNLGRNKFKTGVYHRDSFLVAQNSWLGDHNLNCDAPPTTRSILRENLDDYFYTCKDHFMTSVGDTSGYSIAWFSPTQNFTEINEVCWSVNLTELGSRQWWKVAVLAVGAPDIMSDVEAANLSSLLGNDRAVASWGGIGGAPGKLRIGNQPKDELSLVAGSDKKTRYPACFRDNGNGTMTFEMTGPRNGGELTTEFLTVAGSFPIGPLKVVFQDHNYTPTKDDNGVGGEPIGFTWHWDNISVQ